MILVVGLLVFLIGAVLTLGVGGAFLSAIALLSAPAYVATRWLISRRFAVPLGRGSFEVWLVLGSALIGACGSMVQASAIAAICGPTQEGLSLDQSLLAFAAPVPLGTVPWIAGELLGGESETPALALMSSIGVTYGLSLLGLLVTGARVAPGVVQIASTAVAALGGAVMYLAMRGPTVAPAPPEAIALERALLELDQ